MLATLEGTIKGHIRDALILDVSGVGYRVHVTSETFADLHNSRDKVSFFTHLAVRENSLDIFGFENQKTLEFFELLIGISGIGPRSALSILGLADVETLQSAIQEGDTSYLTKVSGIGKKNAQKIVIELRDKLGSIDSSTGDSSLLKDEQDALDALQSLGYSAKEARDALKEIPKGTVGANERIKEALKILGK